MTRSSFQVYCWNATGERQTQKFREKYVNSILSQEIGWFDDCGINALAPRVAELIGRVRNVIYSTLFFVEFEINRLIMGMEEGQAICYNSFFRLLFHLELHFTIAGN
jgi:hypothetical protein